MRGRAARLRRLRAGPQAHAAADHRAGRRAQCAINGKAGLRAFEAFSVLAPLAALALYAFEQISTAGVLTIIAVEVVASIVYFAQIARMQRIM